MKISEIITDKYKLRIPPTVYYDLLADAQEAEEEQEPILDKIYADIQKLRGCSCSCSDGIIDDVEDILDKYKAESEVEENG